MRDPQTQSHRGFAFVTMARAEDADKAIEKLNGTELHHRCIRVELLLSPQSQSQSQPGSPSTPPFEPASFALSLLS
ncbi:hypothetical protein SYNPS1DRAFT_23521 [Syncephalis pseudoplumigaleata]|uniref:RRM domain-containing protein n=1 Tax=Syncephalis pseudoplumigaleata TaxID=1712513 RepID=A0A4P9YWJ4_9FUNG|nr:hypothetical protein SYNPS1DRAFT_23521 [Syncephalis pseudoplumigaleata]|eukprot:RKP24387.1 hypothetical protein SYNPS1DRAFT_23521 [Syncephalis pseudoplumigaleata]